MSDGRRIVLTGASRGLGLAMTEQFIQRGHTVFGCARNAEAIRLLNRRFGSPHGFDVVDVSQNVQVKGWAESILSSGDAPDLLINNAGVINRNARLWEVPEDEFALVVDVNINGVFHVLRHFLPAMIARERGVIVNFSSAWGRSTAPQVAPYCATKWAIEGLTQALASELPPQMAAVPLNPGVIHTQMLESCFGSSAAAYPSPQNWARKVVPFLLELEAADNGDPLTAPT